jgi:predicted acylesterase/phospholipase RssA
MSDRTRKRARPHIGLALAGGGPEGAVYEIGALRALDEALDGFEAHRLDTYVGVSAGSFIAACLANGMTSGRLCRATLADGEGRLPFRSETFLTPAFHEMLGRTLATPRLAIEALRDYAVNPQDQSLLDAMTRLTRALPVGLFDNEPLNAYLERILSTEGRTNDFRELPTDLTVVAVDLDSGEAVRFGAEGMDHVPISKAVQASSALPGLYPPVEIEGRDYVDGVLLKTVHASVALDAGAKLLFCLNPIVPVDTRDSVEAGVMRRGRLQNRGLPTVLSQTFRLLVHSRLVTGLASYDQRYPDADVILLEPSRADYRMFFTNIFKFSDRRALAQHAYRSTREQLLQRREELEPILANHGIRLNIEVLRRDNDLETSLGLPGRPQPDVTERLDRTLSRLEELLADQGSRHR